MNWCYWCETEIENPHGDICALCAEAQVLFLTAANNAGKLWRELFG